jgi:hypothetical protein
MTAALAAMLSEHVEAINVLFSARAYIGRAFIMERLAKAKVPAIYPFPEAAAEGGLMPIGRPGLSLLRRALCSH